MMQRLVKPKGTYFKRKPNPEFISFVGELVDVNSGVKEKLCGCGSEYAWWKCKRGHELFTRFGCKETEYCPSCSEGYTMSLVAYDMYCISEFYQAVHDGIRYSGYEFTLPKDMWERVADAKSLSELRTIAIKVLKEYYGVEGLLPGGVAVVQHWHSYHPGDNGNVWRGWYPHVHVMVWDRFFKKDGSVVKRRVSLSVSETNELSKRLASRWTQLVERKWGKSSWKGDPENEDSRWNVHYSYGKTYRDVEHRMKYMFRQPVFDVYREVVFNGVRPYNMEIGKRIMRKEKYSQRMTGFGWFSDKTRNGWIGKVKANPQMSCENVECGHVHHVGKCKVMVEHERNMLFAKIGSEYYVGGRVVPVERVLDEFGRPRRVKVEAECECSGTRYIKRRKKYSDERRVIMCPWCGDEMKMSEKRFSFDEVVARDGCVMAYGFSGGGPVRVSRGISESA